MVQQMSVVRMSDNLTMIATVTAILNSVVITTSGLLLSRLPLPATCQHTSLLCLQVVAHLLSWAPPSHCVSSRLIRTLFLYAALEVKAEVCLVSSFN